MRRIWITVFSLLLPLLGGGCVTHHLWTESKLDEWNEPAPNPNLRLFEDRNRNDLMVVYDEFSERHSTRRTRAFFLEPNQAPLAHHTRPDFVNLGTARILSPVPVLSGPPLVPPGSLYAIALTNSTAFTVFFDEYELGSYELPVYSDGMGRMERIALTPVTVTVDATLVGGVLGIGCLYGLGYEGYEWRP